MTFLKKEKPLLFLAMLLFFQACGGDSNQEAGSQDSPVRKGNNHIRFEEKSLGPEIVAPFMEASKDGQHYACVVQRSSASFYSDGYLMSPGGVFVVANGVAGPDYNGIKGLDLSPVGHRLAYLAKRGDKYLAVIDGQESRPYDGITEPVFSPDGRHVAYQAKDGGNWTVVLDGESHQMFGQPGPRHRGIIDGEEKTSRLWFSGDNNHLIYLSMVMGHWFFVTDHVPGEPFNEISAPRFASQTESNIVYRARTGKSWHVVVNGKIMDDIKWFLSIVLSPDGKQMAYKLVEGENNYVVLNGIKGPPWDYVNRNLMFSPDGKRLLYSAEKEDERFLVVNTTKGPSFDKITTPLGQRGYPQFVFNRKGDRYVFTAMKSGFEVAIVDGQTWTGYTSINYPFFSPDGSKVGYRVTRGSKYAAVVNDSVIGGFYDKTSSPIFSADGRRVAVLAKSAGESFVVIDGREDSLRYDDVKNFVFSPDGMRTAYMAINNSPAENLQNDSPSPNRSKQYFAVIDGNPVGPYEQIKNLVFDETGQHITYAALASGAWHVHIDGEKSPGYTYITVGPIFRDVNTVEFIAERNRRVFAVVSRIQE